MLDAILVSLLVIALLATVGYAFIRPWTHIHYHHTGEKLWRPLD